MTEGNIAARRVGGRDWIAELRGTEDEEVFADLVIAAAAAGVPEAEVCEVAEEKFGWEEWARGIFASARERKAKAETVPTAPRMRRNGFAKKLGDAIEAEVASFKKPEVQPEDEETAEFAKSLDAELARQAKIEEPAEEEPAEEETKADLVSSTGGALAVIEPSVPAEETPIEKAVREMNDKHAVISNLGGKCVIMEWVPSPISEGQKELSYQSFQAFRERYANQYVAVPNGRGRWETAPAAPIWLAHPHRRQYEGLDLVPGGPPSYLTATSTCGRVGALSHAKAVGG